MKLAPPPRFLFPTALVVLLVSFGLSGFHAEDDPNDAYAYDRTESVLHLSLEAPAGTSLSAGGPAANIGIYVQRHSWEIWRQPSTGFEEYRDANNAPESGASVNLSLSDAMGTLGDSTVITNADGFATTTYSPDGGSGSVYVNAAVENSTASLFFDVTYTTTGYGESYSYSHTEATLVAELSATGSTDHLYPGESRELSLSVRYETWDVMTNSSGSSRTENHTSAPAEGASVTWISGSGDASVSGYGMADAAGFCQGSLTMGSGDSIVRAEVSYAAGQATSASLYFAAATYVNPSGWTYSRSETIASISNLAAGGSTDLSTGETRSLTGEVRHEVWDVWVNGYGTEEWRYNYAGPAAWATVAAAIEFGGGSLGSTTVTSDGQGWFYLDYTMGSSSSRVTVSADGVTSASGTNGSASVDFTYSSTTGQPDYGNGYDNGGTSSPSLLSYEGNYRIDGPHSDGPTYELTPGTQRTVSGVLYWDSWEVWSDGSGNTFTQNHQSYPATWSGLTLSLGQGDGLIADTSITTDSSGGFTTTFTMGNEASRVRIEATGGSSGTIAAELDFTPPPAGPVDDFVKVREESSLFVALTSGSPQAGTETIPLEAQVTETSWEVWENGIAPAQLRNYRTGPAIAASVEFTIASGSGNLTAIDSLTDADGTARASIIPGQADTVVAVNASFLTTGASGQITVSPVPWVRQSVESRLLLSLQQMDNAITATVRLQSWEIWLNPATGLGEIRHESEGPAVNAEVIFQSLNTSGYDAIFSPPTVMTATAGTASASYPSLAGTMAQVTAHFAGQSVTETIHLPAASGSSGTGNGGWNGNTGNGNTGNSNTGTGNPVDGTNTTGNQNQNNQQTAPDVPMPAVALQGRTHRAQGGGGSFASYYGGNDDTVNIETRYRSYHLALVRDIYGFEHDEVSEEFLDFIAPEESFYAEYELKIAEGWRKANPEDQPQGLNPYEHVDVIPGSSPTYQGAYGSPFWAEGPTLPEFTKGQVGIDIASEREIQVFYEDESNINASSTYWAGSVSPAAMGFPGGWTEDNRIAYGKAPHVGRPILSNHAKFLSGIVPEVQWSEYWLQAESAVPSGKDATYTMSLIATERNADGELTLIEAGTATFVIPATKEISGGLPEIEGFNEADSWLEARADGTLLVRPPVERGVERLLVPVDLKVDYDRDGEEYILGDACDSIPQGERFRFWINNDKEEGEGLKAADAEPGNGLGDSGDSSIHNLRDLEDFTRLHIDLSSFKSEIANGEMEIGLKMSGSGSIGVHYASDKDAGSEQYLFDKSEAEKQNSHNYHRYRTMEVNGQESWFKSTGSDGLSGQMNSDGHLHLIFEGITEGEGDIVLIFRPKDAPVIEGPRVPIKLLPVAKMFEHWTAGRNGKPSVSAVGDRQAMQAAIDAIPAYPSKTLDSGVFDPNGPEEDDVIVFVHGWRMEPWDQISFGETSFKRLWQTGFKGKFFNFSWPTGYTDRADLPGDELDFPYDFDNYADSEEIAYHVGAGPLKAFLDHLNSQYPGKVRLMAHSMGGIVSSEALRAGAQVHTYAACQTAMVGHAYNENLNPRPGNTWETPERYADFPPQNGPIYAGLNGKIFNFHNENDIALRKWRTGQNWKPNESEGYSCHAFDAATNDGNFLYGGDYPPLQFPWDTYEIFAHAAEGRSFALGAEGNGVMKGEFDLANGFTGESKFADDPADHSGQFRGTLMIRWEFWRMLQETAFSITPSKARP
jgi:hypothetical protein